MFVRLCHKLLKRGFVRVLKCSYHITSVLTIICKPKTIVFLLYKLQVGESNLVCILNRYNRFFPSGPKVIVTLFNLYLNQVVLAEIT